MVRRRVALAKGATLLVKPLSLVPCVIDIAGVFAVATQGTIALISVACWSH